MGALPKREIKGSLFQPLSAKATACTLILEEDGLSLKGRGLSLPDRLDIESFQDRKHIHFTSGHYFVADEALTPEIAETYLYLYDFKSSEKTTKSADTNLKRSKAKTTRFLNSLENLTAAKITILVCVFIAVLVGFRFTWPLLTEPIVAMIPVNVDKSIGENTYKQLDGRLFKPSKLPKEQIDRLTKRGEEMAVKAQLTFRPKIYFHESILGANAVAFPGGPIVVTDDLVKLLKDDGLILAVIGHEYGHVEERHSMHQIVHIAGITVLATLIFGADESLLEELGAIAVGAWSFKNRRNHEHDADIFSLKILKENNLDPKLMVTAMEKLTHHFCDKTTSKKKVDADKKTQLEACKNAETGWFSSHPSSPERIDNMNKAIQAQ